MDRQNKNKSIFNLKFTGECFFVFSNIFLLFALQIGMAQSFRSRLVDHKIITKLKGERGNYFVHGEV